MLTRNSRQGSVALRRLTNWWRRYCREAALVALQFLCTGGPTDNKKYPDAVEDIRVALELLAEDAFHPQLRTHKLKGKLKGSWSCSARYDLGIVFRFVQYEGTEAILLETVGTHEEVY